MGMLGRLTMVMAAAMATVSGAQSPTRLGPAMQPRVEGASRPGATSGVPSPRKRPLTREDLDAWLDGYIPHAMATGDIPGAVVVVVKDGRILTSRGFGYADVARRLRVDPDRTLFRPGSVSKLFTWTAVMQLVEQGRLDLDRDVNGYLDFRIPAYRGQPVTLRQIMTHTGGFEESGDRVVVYDRGNLQPLGEHLRTAIPERVYAPGTTPAYSNWATALAGHIVERRSGETFDDYVERHIFAPLGMRSSSFRQPLPPALLARLAKPYPRPGELSGFEYVGPAPAGSLSSSGTDMARFMIAHLQGGEIGGSRILRPDTVRMMHDSPLDRVNPASLVPPLNRMELGFFEMDVGHPGVVGHLGDLNAFHTSLDLFTRENVGIYVSVNGSGREKAGGALRLALPTDFADRYFDEDAAPDGRVDPETAVRHARMMAGQWDASRRAHSSFLAVVYALGQTKVAVGPKGELVIPDVVGENGRPREWVEIAPFVWRDRDSRERLAAKVVDGRVVRWAFDLIAPWEVFDRAPPWRSMAWIMPALYASLAILLLTFIHRPAAWAVRRRYKAAPTVSGAALEAYRATGLMAGLDLAILAGWAVLVTRLLNALPSGPQIFVPWLWLLQIAGVVLLPGAVIVAGWNAWLTWRDRRPWTRRLWNALVVLATAHVLYFATTFGLVAMTVNY